MLIVSSVIGAGFASGREIISFFSSPTSIIIAPLIGVGIFLISSLFLHIGSKLNTNCLTTVNKALLGKAHFAGDGFLLANSLIVLSAMFAGFSALGNMFLDVPIVFPLIAAVLCVLIVYTGTKGLLKVNRFLMPVVIISLVAISIVSMQGRDSYSSNGNGVFGFQTIGFLFLYLSMNMLLASTVLTTMGKISKKEVFISSALAGVFLGILTLFLVIALNRYDVSNVELPLLYIAGQMHLSIYIIVIAVLAISILTTMFIAMNALVAWINNIFKNRLYSSILVLLIAISLSNLGFSGVVRFLYPVIGVLGLTYITAGIIFVIRQKRMTNQLQMTEKCDKLNK